MYHGDNHAYILTTVRIGEKWSWRQQIYHCNSLGCCRILKLSECATGVDVDGWFSTTMMYCELFLSDVKNAYWSHIRSLNLAEPILDH